MDENREYQSEQIAKLEEAIRALPVKLQNAIYWAISNYDALEAMGKASNMTLEDIQRAMERALSEENYATLMLLHFTKIAKESKENEEI